MSSAAPDRDGVFGDLVPASHLGRFVPRITFLRRHWMLSVAGSQLHDSGNGVSSRGKELGIPAFREVRVVVNPTNATDDEIYGNPVV